MKRILLAMDMAFTDRDQALLDKMFGDQKEMDVEGMWSWTDPGFCSRGNDSNNVRLFLSLLSNTNIFF